MNLEHVLTLIRQPRISEKATLVAERCNQYVFQVLPAASKPEIKQAIEFLYKVEVAAVTVLNVKGKQKNFKQRAGKRKDWKKAYVTLKENHAINFGVSE